MGDFRAGFSKKVRSLSRYKYGQDKRIVEYEILKRSEVKPKEEKTPLAKSPIAAPPMMEAPTRAPEPLAVKPAGEDKSE